MDAELDAYMAQPPAEAQASAAGTAEVPPPMEVECVVDDARVPPEPERKFGNNVVEILARYARLHVGLDDSPFSKLSRRLWGGECGREALLATTTSSRV